MSRKNILVGGGLLAVTIGLVAIIGMNLDNNIGLNDAINYLVPSPNPQVSTSSSSLPAAPSPSLPNSNVNAPGLGGKKGKDVPTGPVPVSATTATNIGSTAQTKLVNQLKGLSSSYIPDGRPRFQQHITIEKSVYLNGELLIAAV